MEIIKVSSKSSPQKIAGAIANIFRENESVEVQAVGAGAINQAIKGITIARCLVFKKKDNMNTPKAIRSFKSNEFLSISASCSFYVRIKARHLCNTVIPFLYSVI